MAHEISIVNGKASMAFVGDKPWHGLGQELTQGASIETWNKEAGMDWMIKDSPIRFDTPEGDAVYTGSRILYRGDTMDQLSIVSDDYKVVQPSEVLEFFRDLVSLQGMELQTAGVLFGGRRFWAMADTGRQLDVLGSDRVKGNLLLVTSCDGTMATRAQFVATRVVCANTLSMAMAEKDGTSSRVTHRSVFDPKSVKKELGLFDDAWERFRQSMVDMSKFKMSDRDAHKFVRSLLVNPKREEDKQSYTVERDVENILHRAKHGMGSDKTYGTLWGVLNGVTEFVDHDSRNRIADRALWSSWFGKGNVLKEKALQSAMHLLAA